MSGRSAERENSTASPSTVKDLTALFVFGDSLSDVGNDFVLSAGNIPPPELTSVFPDGTPVDLDALGIRYLDGFYTNGPNYVAVSAERLNLPDSSTPSFDGGTNFARGNLSALGDIRLSAQVDFLEAALAEMPAGQSEALLANAGASLFLGASDLNDILGNALTLTGFDEVAIAEQIGAVVTEIVAQATRLVSLGIDTLVFQTTPPVSFFPAAQPFVALLGGTEQLDALSAVFNAQLEAQAAAFEARGVNAEIVEFGGLAREIASDGATFGFQSLGGAITGIGLEPNVVLVTEDVPVDQLGFLDDVHFTSELHEVFGVFQSTTLGSELIVGTGAADALRGGFGAQTIFAEAGTDLIQAGFGNDLVFAGTGDDGVFGGVGDDTLFGGTGDDTVIGGAGRDIASGGAGDDVVFGRAGSDLLAGNAGDDLLAGGNGNDLLIGGTGTDRAFGGLGSDTFLLRVSEDAEGSAGDVFFGGRGQDTLLIVVDEPVGDEDAFLESLGIVTVGIERIEFLSSETFEVSEINFASEQLETAELFGFL